MARRLMFVELLIDASPLPSLSNPISIYRASEKKNKDGVGLFVIFGHFHLYQ